MRKIIIAVIALTISITACDNSQPAFPDKPSREAYEGFEWEVVAGDGLKFWAQKNPYIRIVTDDSLQGAKIKYDEDNDSYSRVVIQVFPLENGSIEDLIPILKESYLDEYNLWNDEDECAFRPINSDRKGVERYILTPTGEAEKRLTELGKSEPIPCTCGGWGVWNSGMRYFEIHSSHPNKAIFVEIGQEAPLFDEMSITLTE